MTADEKTEAYGPMIGVVSCQKCPRGADSERRRHSSGGVRSTHAAAGVTGDVRARTYSNMPRLARLRGLLDPFTGSD